MGDLAGKVLAVVGRGDEGHRAIAVACAEAGATIALGSLDRSTEQEYAVNSIGNEIWSIGEKFLVRVMDAADPTAAPAFADECWDTFGRCDTLVVTSAPGSEAPIEALSSDEWDVVFRDGATIPYLFLQAFGRLMVRQGGGTLFAIFPRRDQADAAERGARAALDEVTGAFDAAWRGRRVTCSLLETPDTAAIVRATGNPA